MAFDPGKPLPPDAPIEEPNVDSGFGVSLTVPPNRVKVRAFSVAFKTPRVITVYVSANNSVMPMTPCNGVRNASAIGRVQA